MAWFRSGSLAGGGEVNINILFLWNSLHGFYEVPTFLLCPSPSNTVSSVSCHFLLIKSIIWFLPFPITLLLWDIPPGCFQGEFTSHGSGVKKKKSPCQCMRCGFNGPGRSLGEGNGNPLQYSCLGNPIDRGAWWATVHGFTKSETQLSA